MIILHLTLRELLFLLKNCCKPVIFFINRIYIAIITNMLNVTAVTTRKVSSPLLGSMIFKYMVEWINYIVFIIYIRGHWSVASLVPPESRFLI